MRKNKSLTGIKKRRPAAVLAALLMAAAVVSGSILLPDIYVAAENVQTEEKEPLYPEKEHTHLDYSELAYEGYDETQRKNLCRRQTMEQQHFGKHKCAAPYGHS